MPVAVGRQTEAALAAGGERHAGVKGRPQRPDALGDFGAKYLPKVLIGADCGAKVCQIRLEGKGGHQRHFAVDNRFQCLVIHVGGMQDHVEARDGGIPRAAGVATVPDDRDAKLMRGVADELQFVQRPGGDLTPLLAGPNGESTDVDFDPVDPHFDLLVDLFHDLIGRVHNPRIAPGAFVRQESCSGAADTVDQDVAAGGHSGSLNDTTLDRIAEIHPNIEYAVRIKEAGEPGAKHLLCIDSSNERSQTIAAMKEQLIIAVGVIETDMTVAVDHARHHATPGCVDFFDRCVGWAAGARIRAHGHNALAADQHIASEWVGPCPIDDESVLNQRVSVTHSGCSLMSPFGWKSAWEVLLSAIKRINASPCSSVCRRISSRAASASPAKIAEMMAS